MVTEEVFIDHRVHPRIIGGKGRNVRKIMDDYNVDIRFPRSDSNDPDLVIVTGPEDAVYDCKDHLLNLQEEYVSALEFCHLMEEDEQVCSFDLPFCLFLESC